MSNNILAVFDDFIGIPISWSILASFNIMRINATFWPSFSLRLHAVKTSAAENNLLFVEFESTPRVNWLSLSDSLIWPSARKIRLSEPCTLIGSRAYHYNVESTTGNDVIIFPDFPIFCKYRVSGIGFLYVESRFFLILFESEMVDFQKISWPLYDKNRGCLEFHDPWKILDKFSLSFIQTPVDKLKI